MLELIEDLGMLLPKETSKQKRRFGIFKCKCGNHFKAQVYTIKTNAISSCGCKVSTGKSKHLLAKSRLYRVYSNIKTRCFNIKNSTYQYYGLLGVTMCDEWKNDFKAFYDWAIANGYNKGLTIDRIDVNGNYEPSNCRWVRQEIQKQNQRRLRSTNKSGYRGVNWSKTRKKWISRISINNQRKNIGAFDCRLQAAYARDEYIILHNLEHTKNFN